MISYAEGGSTTKINPILPETVRMSCYVIYSNFTQLYYKGEYTLDALSLAYFCGNGIVFNWCSYLLEELFVSWEESQEKGGTFTYGYLLVVFSMLKWMPHVRRPLSPSNKG